MKLAAMVASNSSILSARLKDAARRVIGLTTSASFLVASLAPAYAQQIVDPTAPIQFRPGVASSGNGTPTINIVRPSTGGVSHNKFREYNIDTRGVILNNSGLGGTSLIGGAVAPNPNLSGGSSAKIIVNEVTGAKRSKLNGPTEVFGTKADVIVANPNGVDCVGCGFINTGTATLTTGAPIVDYDAGTVGLETRGGDITISGAGVSAPAGSLGAGHRPDNIRIIGKSIKVDGLVDADNKAQLRAGSIRTDGASGASTAIAGDPQGAGIISGADGVIRAGSIEVLSTDVDTGVVLSGNLQALGALNAAGVFVPGNLSIVSAGNLSLMSGEAAGNITVKAAHALQLARDLSAMGEIAITATDIALADTAGVHAGQGLKIVASRDIASGAIMKAGAALSVEAGRDATFSGLIASAKDIDLRAGGSLATDTSTIVAPTLRLGGANVSSIATWFSPGVSGSVSGVNVELGKDTVIDSTKPFAVTATQQLTIGTVIDAAEYPNLSLAFHDLAISPTGAFIMNEQELVANQLLNAGLLLSSGQLTINAMQVENAATGVIKAATLAVNIGADLTNLGQILSQTTLSLLAQGRVTNTGSISANDNLVLEAVSYVAGSPAAELAARNVSIILDQSLTNAGSILAAGTASITVGGNVSNSGAIRSNADLTLVAADIVNIGDEALIGSNADLRIHGAKITNTLGALQANGSFELIAANGLSNSGLISAKADASLSVMGLTNAASGEIHAGVLDIDLGQGALTNLGQIVSAGTLTLLKAGTVVNDGDIQAKGSLRLEALSYAANSSAATLIGQKLEIVLKGKLSNAGLVYGAGGADLTVVSLTNAASGKIHAGPIDIALGGGNLSNAGEIISIDSLTVLNGGDVINNGAMQAKEALLLKALSYTADAATANLTASQADLVLSGLLSNAGLIYSKNVADLDVVGLANKASGNIHAGVLDIDLGQGDLTNLGQIVSADALNILKAGTVVNDGAIQAKTDLRLEALAYVANSDAAMLGADRADVILKGALTNAGLIAVANDLNLDVGGSMANGADAQIMGGKLEAAIAGNLTNLGKLLSETTLKASIAGLANNSGVIQANGDLSLTVRDLENSGTEAEIASTANVNIKATGSINNEAGMIMASDTLTLTATNAITNSGLVQATDVNATASSLSNQAAGRILALKANAPAGAAPAGTLVIKLTGNLANLGQIASAKDADIRSGGTVTNAGAITSSGDLRLQAVSYVPSSPAAKLAAYNLHLILSGSYTNSGELGAIGFLDLDIGGDFTNTAAGKITAGDIDLAVGGKLTNLGSIVSEQSLRAVVNGLLTNEGQIRAGAALILEAAKLINRGEDALIATAGDLAIRTTGDLENTLGQIKAVKTVDIDVGGMLTNASGRIESGDDMQIVAQTLLNTALEGTGAGVQDFYQLGQLTVDYWYDKDRHLGGSDHENVITATQHEFSGYITTNKPGVIRSGGDLLIHTNVTNNQEGYILAVNDLSIDTQLLINDAQVYTVDHFINEWGHSYGDYWSSFIPISGPSSGWSTYRWGPDILTDAALDMLIGRMEVYNGPGNGDAGGIGGAGYAPNAVIGEVIVGYETRYYTVSGSDGNERQVAYQAPITKPASYLRDTADGRMIVYNQAGSLLITGGSSPVSIRGSDDIPQSFAEELAGLSVFSNADAATLLNLAALGIDPDNIPEVIVISNTPAQQLGTGVYQYKGRTHVGVAEVLNGSVIKAGGTLFIDADYTVNRGTLDGELVVIEGGTLDNGVGTITGFDPGTLALSDGTLIGSIGSLNPAAIGLNGGSAGSVVNPVSLSLNGGATGSLINPAAIGLDGGVAAGAVSGATIGLNGGLSGSVDFVLDSVMTPVLNLGGFNSRNLYSLDTSNFGNLVRLTGSAAAARLLGSAHIAGNSLTFYADPVAEAKALADAALKLAGTQLVVDPSLSLEQQREQLYLNAEAFAARTGARFGVALTEAQRAALDQPIVWYETRIVDGKSVLAPRLYLPSNDELLRGARGAGLVNAGDLVVDLGGALNNSGAIVAAGLASISASAIVNQRMLNLDDMSREFAAGRGDTGLISAGTLFMATDFDLANYGGTIAAAGDIDLRIGGSLINETQRYARAVDGFDLCMGSACGAAAVDYNIARIVSGRDLTIIADRDIVNRGGELGAVTDMLLAAGRNIEFETLKDSYLVQEVHQRGFLSGTDIVNHAIVDADATAQSLLGSVSMFAGYGVCDGGALCAEGRAPGDVILNGALVSAFDTLSIDATGRIDMGTVSEEVNNTYKNWGFSGLSWSTVKQTWNDVDTSVTQLSGYDVILQAKGPITGTGVKIAAVNDLLMKTDDTIRLEAAQDALYFTEKGFSIGLSFPGSAGIDAALRGASGQEVLEGLGSMTPLTATLARLGSSENGIGAAAAALYVGVGGLNGFNKLLSGDPSSLIENGLGGLTPETFLSRTGIMISGWKKDQRWSESQVSELTAGGDIVLQAGLDVLLTQGAQLVAGDDVYVDAGRDIVLSALSDYARQKSSSFGLTINPFALSASASFSSGRGDSTTYTNGRIAAADNVYLTARRDVNLIGGVVAGARVDIAASGDLNIVSLQDTANYKGSQFGLTISFMPAGPGVSGTYGSTKASYANVAEQSGIVAGDGGYRIDVEGNVDLTAGLIVSSADPAFNSLEAGSLTFSDLENVSKAKTSSYGIGLSPTGVLTPSVGQPAEMREDGTALSTLSPGQIVLHDQDGDGIPGTSADRAATQALLASINQDASLTNAQVGMYDLEALRNRQLDAAVISQALNMAVGDIAQAAGLAEGSPQKVALHAAAGAITALVSGGDVGIGALSGGASEIANAVLVQALKDNPALTQEQRNAILQWGAVLVGAAIGGGQGAAMALDNVNHNYLKHQQILDFDKEMKECNGDADCREGVKSKYRQISLAHDAEIMACTDQACREFHQAEIERASGAAQQYLNPYTQADPEVVAMLYNLQRPEHISLSMEISHQREIALQEALENCPAGNSACVEEFANDRFESWLDRQTVRAALAGAGLSRAVLLKNRIIVTTNTGLPDGVSFGRNANQDHHVWRHVEDELGMSRLRVQDTVVADLPPVADLSAGLNVRFVTVDGVRLRYNAFKLPDGIVNIGRIHEAN